MSDLTRRQLLGILASIPAASMLEGTPAAIERAVRHARRAVEGADTVDPEFFTPEEWRTVRVLSDLIIPRDSRSGSATDAGVPEFIDFMMLDRPSLQSPIRDGLRWLDDESLDRGDHPFVELDPKEQGNILDDIAWPDRAPPEMEEGVEFFNRFRDLVASGFFSSRIGVEDLQFRGNTADPAWNGCPEEALRELGVSYGPE